MIKIFLVEDEVFALRTLHRKILDLQEDYEIVGTATDGTEALPKILAAKPAIVMTDIRMSDMDGLTLIQMMREKYPSVRCYVVTETENYIEQASAIRVNGYLLKPVSAEQIHRAMFEGSDAGDET